MKLIYIYGPPAVGKLTIAKELSSQTGIPLLHNHLTRDLVQTIYGEELPSNYGLVRKLIIDVLVYCAKKNTDLILTFVYAGKKDDEVVKSYMDAITENGGEVLFVELKAGNETLIDRVTNESRKEHKKLLDPDVLKEILQDKSVKTVPFASHLGLDTDKFTVQESAMEIIKEYGL